MHLKTVWFLVTLFAIGVGVPVVAARDEHSRAAPQASIAYEISLDRESKEESGDGSSGSSTDRDTVVECVIAVRDGGLELEYDLPKDTSAQDRVASWQFPARVFKPLRGPMQLLNRAELEARVDRWLKSAKWSRDVCGHWIFTWNAFRIECDPESVLETIGVFDLRSADLRDGAPYLDKEGLGTAPLTRKVVGAVGTTFTAELKLDPEVARQARARTDVAVGEITRRPMTLDIALQSRATEAISGTISVVFETDPVRNALRRTRVIKLVVKDANGVTTTRTVTETLERKQISRD